MRKNTALPLFVRLAIVCTIVGTAAVLLGRSASRSNDPVQLGVDTGTRIQSPSVFVETQPISPLRILLVEIQQTGNGTVELVFELTNVSTIPIQAFTIQQRVAVGEKQRNDAVFIDLSLSDLSLPPKGSRREATIVEAHDPKLTIGLSVDFVEFADETAWGVDSSESAERLKGQRAGFATSAVHFREIFRKEGAAGLTRALQEDTPRFPTPTGHSANWEEGFRSGGGIARGRIKKTIDGGDIKQVEVLLDRSASRRTPK